MTNGSLTMVESTFDLHLAIIGLGNQFLVCLRVAVHTGFTVLGHGWYTEGL